MPRKPKRPCSYPGCPNLTDGRYCEEHERIMNRQYEKYGRNKASKKSYGRAWQKIRARYIAAHPLCEQCLKRSKITPAEEVHHIRPLSRGGTHEIKNLMSLCKACHSQITARDGDRWHTRTQTWFTWKQHENLKKHIWKRLFPPPNEKSSGRGSQNL